MSRSQAPAPVCMLQRGGWPESPSRVHVQVRAEGDAEQLGGTSPVSSWEGTLGREAVKVLIKSCKFPLKGKERH